MLCIAPYDWNQKATASKRGPQKTMIKNVNKKLSAKKLTHSSRTLRLSGLGQCAMLLQSLPKGYAVRAIAMRLAAAN
ncbi:hypothetical protein GUJ93_ZPchr0005g16352 [Zizania palustris]|uniref:Uncharacterized protein n=1 Tax=Zizania palustris TaxID=103762 RepID=A0A8J5W221_ZIZPA|nr:hypothetical protein GUJ93_ZPchr0005g16352 [Zizania palustris]